MRFVGRAGKLLCLDDKTETLDVHLVSLLVLT